MKKEVIVIPKGKCPFDIFRQMEEQQLKNSWIFIHENAYQKLISTKEVNYWALGRKKTKIEFESIKLYCDIPPTKGWGKITCIEIENNIPCVFSPIDPEELLFINIEE